MIGIGRGRSGAGWSMGQQTQAPKNPLMEMYNQFSEMFGGESPMISRQFDKARESSKSRIAALGGGNIRAIKESEEGLAMGESAAQQESLMARQMMGAQLLEMLKKLGMFGGQRGAGQALYER